MIVRIESLFHFLKSHACVQFSFFKIRKLLFYVDNFIITGSLDANSKISKRDATPNFDENWVIILSLNLNVHRKSSTEIQIKFEVSEP